jgi:transcriptional regulator GlxA family with amidase domain
MSSRLNHIDDWFERLVLANYKISALAKQCRVTERQLRRFFRLKFGCSPRSWVSEQRRRVACSLLSTTELVKEIAAAVGFKQPSSFSRHFKAHHKTSPSSFRTPEL